MNSSLGILGALTIMSLGIAAATSSLGTLLKGSSRIVARNAVQANATSAMELVLTTGRLAAVCAKRVGTPCAPAAVAMECAVDYQNTGELIPTTNVRFETDCEGNLQMQQRSGDSNTEAWIPKLNYFGISKFEICDSNDMNTPGGCPITGGNFTSVSNRFFRVRMTTLEPCVNSAVGECTINGGKIALVENRNFRNGVKTIQTSFHVRNAGFAGTTLYQWGSRN